jgi:predicted Zn-dependent protease
MWYRLTIIWLILLLAGCGSLKEGFFKADKFLMNVSDKISKIDPITGKREINFESQTAEVKRTQKQTAFLLKQFKIKKLKIDAQNKEFSQVVRVFNQLKQVVHQPNLPWEVHLIEDKGWNAFTIGGGKIFVYTGIFQGKFAIRSDDELAAILAHEMAHVNARHASEGQGKRILSKILDKRLRSQVYQASFTTLQEDEADRYSVVYMALAGYNPQKASVIWKRLDYYLGSQPVSNLYDHPLNKTRALNLARYAQSAKMYYQAGIINKHSGSLLRHNQVFSYRRLSKIRAGSGGGLTSLLEVFGNAYLEAEKAKKEQAKR